MIEHVHNEMTRSVKRWSMIEHVHPLRASEEVHNVRRSEILPHEDHLAHLRHEAWKEGTLQGVTRDESAALALHIVVSRECQGLPPVLRRPHPKGDQTIIMQPSPGRLLIPWQWKGRRRRWWPWRLHRLPAASLAKALTRWQVRGWCAPGRRRKVKAWR